MDVSNEIESEPDGQELIQKVLSLTRLPEHWARKELNEILVHYGEVSDPNSVDLTLDQLREALAAYLESIHAELTEKDSSVVAE